MYPPFTTDKSFWLVDRLLSPLNSYFPSEKFIYGPEFRPPPRMPVCSWGEQIAGVGGWIAGNNITTITSSSNLTWWLSAFTSTVQSSICQTCLAWKYMLHSAWACRYFCESWKFYCQVQQEFIPKILFIIQSRQTLNISLIVRICRNKTEISIIIISPAVCTNPFKHPFIVFKYNSHGNIVFQQL